jgi:hypothetical protein
MAVQSLAERSFTLHEFGKYLSRHPVTIRRWFDKDKEVIRTPRGGQRAQILIPIPRVITFCQEIGIPQDQVDEMLKDHHEQFLKSIAQAAAVMAPVKRTNGHKPAKKKARARKAGR